ncbi:MAG: DUF1501 domain-containing protein [Pseudolabrys sp.]
MNADLHNPTRRQLLLGSGALFAWANVPKIARAEGRDPRFLVIVLRGALDGLATVAPVGDPDWFKLRGDAALGHEGSNAALPLDGFFALNPAMPELHRIYKAGQAIVVHAVATPYRERSHFDGQDVLESGMPKPGAVDSGWLNRTLSSLASGGRVPDAHGALAVGAVTPLVVRGPAPIISWAPTKLPPPTEDTLGRLLDLYRHTDPALAHVLEERVGIAAIAGVDPMRMAEPSKTPMPTAGRRDDHGAARVKLAFASSASAAARFFAKENGPRVGALVFDGWDTHANEGETHGRLATLLGALDGAIAAVERGMGPAWSETAVAVVTEFGRTAHINGTLGTDHGTATVALLAGGALKGGRVIADWPGLADTMLYGGRDLKPTTDLRAVLKGVLKDHLRVSGAALDTAIFPDSAAAKPLTGIMA